MAEVVFVLGAGASVMAGAPLMYDFIDRARDLFLGGQISEENTRKNFQDVFDAISLLQRAHSKSELDIDNIESVFAALEMADTIQRLGTYNQFEIRSRIESLKMMIQYTLEKSMNFRVVHGHPAAPLHYDTFGRTVFELVRPTGARRVRTTAVLTFNYDVGVEMGLADCGLSIDYGFNPIDRSQNAVPVLKLHGSINWGICPECRVVVPWDVSDYRNGVQVNQLFQEDPEHCHLPIGSHVCQKTIKHCNREKMTGPFIVPPTWNKGQYYSEISPVWQRAAAEIAEATQIVVMGYSLPLSDHFFRMFYALATISDVALRQFIVCDPSDTSRQRFRELLGPGARGRFKEVPKYFDQALDDVRNMLRSAT